MALQQDDVETARGVLEDAQENIQQVSEQAGDKAQPELGEVDQSIQQALDALAQDDLEAAQQALEDAKVPMQRAMLEPAGQRPSGQQPAGQQPASTAQPATATAAGGQPADQQPEMAAQQPADREPATTAQPETATAAGSQPATQEPATTAEPEIAAAEGSEQPASATADASPLAEIPASELLGQEVVNDQGDTVAEIVDMVKRPDSDEVFAVLSVGGFLGLGEKEVAMPLDRFDVGADQEIVLSNATEEELKNMPDWEDDGTFESVSQ